VFGFLGYACKKIDFPVAPMAFTLILGPLTEKALRQALSMSGGDLAILTRGPLATGLLVAAAVTLLTPLGVYLWGRRRASAT
jgi:putative tricarboxylic transport membrane protein